MAPPPGPLTTATSVSATMQELSSRMKHVYFIWSICKEHCFFKHASQLSVLLFHLQSTHCYLHSKLLPLRHWCGSDVACFAHKLGLCHFIQHLENTTVHHITTSIFFLTFISFLLEIFLHVVIVKSQSPPLQLLAVNIPHLAHAHWLS